MMHKIYLFLLVVVNLNLYAQDFEIEDINKSQGLKNKIELGIDAGPSLRWMRGNLYLDYLNSPTSGFFSGINARYRFSNYMSIQLNFIYERKGSVAKSIQFDTLGNPSEHWKVNTNFDYLKAPVLFTFNIDNVFLNVGPYFSYLLKEELVNQKTGYKKDYTKLNKRFDTGLVIGIGMMTPIHKRISALMEVRKNIGFYNVSSVPVFNNGTVKTNSVNLLFGIRYQI